MTWRPPPAAGVLDRMETALPSRGHPPADAAAAWASSCVCGPWPWPWPAGPGLASLCDHAGRFRDAVLLCSQSHAGGSSPPENGDKAGSGCRVTVPSLSVRVAIHTGDGVGARWQRHLGSRRGRRGGLRALAHARRRATSNARGRSKARPVPHAPQGRRAVGRRQRPAAGA